MVEREPPRVLSQPVSAYRALEARATLATAGLLVALAAVAWWSTISRARGMEGMTMGLGSIGTAMMPFGMDSGVFELMWVTMMVAMMFPTIAPIVLLHRMVMRRAGVGRGRTVAFVGGYLVVWALAGLVPLAVLLTFRSVAHEQSWVAPVSGVVLVLAGLYQFTGWKRVCQRVCQTPLTFLSTHDFGSGSGGALRAGVVHGAFCLGCCWALMAVLFVVGLMNLAWMAVISVVFLAEKHLSRGLLIAQVAGTVLVGLGAAVVVHPALLGSLVA